MKKNLILILLLLLCLPFSAMADGIAVKARDTDINRSRDKNITNILILLQEDNETIMAAVASVNTKTAKAVMVSIDPDLMVEIPETGGEVPFSQVYSLGDRKSKGFLAVRTVNRLLALNITTYVALDMEIIPELVDAVESVEITPTVEEDRALGLDEDTWALDAEETVAYMHLTLPDDDRTKNRSYEVMLQLLRQAAAQDLMSMMGIGRKLLSSMDTNLGIMSAISLGNTLKGGEHHTDLFLPQLEAIVEENPLHADAAMMEQLLSEVIYE